MKCLITLLTFKVYVYNAGLKEGLAHLIPAPHLSFQKSLQLKQVK